MPLKASPIRVCAWAAVYVALMVSLLRTEGVHLGLEALGREGELLLLALERGVLRLQVRHLLLEGGAARERLAGQVLAAEGERLAALVLQLGGLRLQLVELELQTLAGGGDVGHTRRTF